MFKPDKHVEVHSTQEIMDDINEISHQETLRDHFAAQALNGALARTAVPEYELKAMFGSDRAAIRREEIIAADAYRISDAMIEARKR